jgi:hypothetical protein
MKAQSIKGTSPVEIQLALQQAMGNNFKPTLAFVFMSINNDIDEVSGPLDKTGIQIFGGNDRWGIY